MAGNVKLSKAQIAVLERMAAKVALLTEALNMGVALVSDESGWGTVRRMEGSELYEDATRFVDAARAALDPKP